LADYRERYLEIKSAGASLVAVSVDPPETSEALRTQLSLPFPVLCDTERCVVKDWDIYNSRERGGIAKPAVFVIDPNQVVRYASVDSVATRVPAVEIVHFLQNAANALPIRRRVHVPKWSEWIRAIRNNFQSQAK
jgi:peroxiredoxin